MRRVRPAIRRSRGRKHPARDGVGHRDFVWSHACAHGGGSVEPPAGSDTWLGVGLDLGLPLLPTLAAAHRVTMIDAIGQVSKSIATKPIHRSGLLVAWLDETLRALGIDPAAMVGISMGAWIATHYALAFPDRVDRLALIAPAGLVSGLHLRFPASCLPHRAFWRSEARLESFFDIWLRRRAVGGCGRTRGD